jgi:phosphoribosyl 1,2-cyclic phosphodiesterase
MHASPHKHVLSIRMLASGSGGNAILFSVEKMKFLIDAGLSCRELERRLALANVNVSDLQAVFVTHEHTDHIRGVGVLSRKHKIPIYMNKKTLAGTCSAVGDIPTVVEFRTGDVVELGDFSIQTYSVPHDASDPVGLCIQNSTCRIGVALDMGYSTKLVKQRLCNSDVLILEFNHDKEMLLQCNRPWELKQRILSKTGHMSNDAALALLSELMHERLRAVVLAHVSKEANCPHHALSLVDEHLKKIGRTDIRIFVGDQDHVGRPILV